MPLEFIQMMERVLETHPAILLIGPPGVAEFRVVQSLYYHWMPTDDDRSLLCLGTHPDFIQLDARTLKTERAREIRSQLTASPARLRHRFFSVLYAERIHSAAAQTFLKIVEEPPPDLRIIFSSECPSMMLQTLVSRSIPLRVPRLATSECIAAMESYGIDSVEWRARVSGNDPRIGREVDKGVVEEWVDVWKALIVGALPPPTFAWSWVEKFKAGSEATELVCWNVLIELCLRGIQKICWMLVSELALMERDRLIHGWDRKMATPNTLARVYALMKTLNREAQSQ